MEDVKGDPAPIWRLFLISMGKQYGLSHNNAPIPENNGNAD